MSIATLINPDDPAFDFEHQKAHETMIFIENQKAGSTNSSGLPYWLDPAYGDTAIPAGWQNSLHTQAHADFIRLFPAPYGGSGIASLNDIALRPEPEAWARFANYQLHLVANQTF